VRSTSSPPGPATWCPAGSYPSRACLAKERGPRAMRAASNALTVVYSVGEARGSILRTCESFVIHTLEAIT
jgi:hypothetical protein